MLSVVLVIAWFRRASTRPELLWHVPTPIVAAIVVGDDVDGDGTPDVYISRTGWSTVEQSGEFRTPSEFWTDLRLLSGANGSTVWSVELPGERGHRLRLASDAAFDFDEDGVSDLLLAEYEWRGKPARGGRFSVVSGRTGERLRLVCDGVAGDRTGFSVCLLAPAPNGGRAIAVVGAIQSSAFDTDHSMRARIHYDAEGFATRTDEPDPSPHLGPGFVTAFDLGSGAQLWRVEGESLGDLFGYSLCRLPDLDGDGIPDIAVGAPLADTFGGEAGEVRILSGATGAPLAVIGPTDEERSRRGDRHEELRRYWTARFGFSLAWAPASEVNGEALLGIAGCNSVWFAQLRGTDFQLERVREKREVRGFPWISLLQDTDGDELPELLTGEDATWFCELGTHSRAAVIESASGDVAWRLPSLPDCGNLGVTPARPPGSAERWFVLASTDGIRCYRY